MKHDPSGIANAFSGAAPPDTSELATGCHTRRLRMQVSARRSAHRAAATARPAQYRRCAVRGRRWAKDLARVSATALHTAASTKATGPPVMSSPHDGQQMVMRFRWSCALRASASWCLGRRPPGEGNASAGKLDVPYLRPGRLAAGDTGRRGCGDAYGARPAHPYSAAWREEPAVRGALRQYSQFR